MKNNNLLNAINGIKPDLVPVWFMRQAGRSLPEYRELRASGTILEAIRNPDLATEITLQPTRRYDVDAAVLFSDIITPLAAAGYDIEIKKGVGPVTNTPIQNESSLKEFDQLNPDKDLKFQTETIKNLTSALDIPVIGFCGAPFTLSTYLIEGKPSKNHNKTKMLMLNNPKLWHKLNQLLTEIVITNLKSQIEAGVQVVQIFDSWAGVLNPDLYKEFALEYIQQIVESVKQLKIPTILFGTNTGSLIKLFSETGTNVVGVDSSISLKTAREIVGSNIGLQGNLEPAYTTTNWDLVQKEVDKVLTDNDGNCRYIFNLGHGVLPESKPELLSKIVDYVHKAGTEMMK